MKKFFIGLLVCIMVGVGFGSVITFAVSDTPIVILVAILLSALVFYPALFWWTDYFDKLFNNHKKEKL